MKEKISKFIKENKLLVTLIALVLVAAIVALSIFVAGKNNKPVNGPTPSEPTSSEQGGNDSSSDSSSSTPSEPVKVELTMDELYAKFNAKIDIDDNFFMDSLEYSGYNLKKHRADGEMWNYILAAQKRGRGWLSNITYGGGCSGYETTADGKPDLEAFADGGLVCASYISYVYYNYLGNVEGIDVSGVQKAEDPLLAHSWYTVAKQWIADGYAKEIKYYAGKKGAYIDFRPEEQVPIGSLIVFQDERNQNGHSTHVALYAGYKNNYHWVYHVGNENGPEFCAIERMSCGPDPQAMLMVISTPTQIVEGILEKMGE